MGACAKGSRKIDVAVEEGGGVELNVLRIIKKSPSGTVGYNGDNFGACRYAGLLHACTTATQDRNSNPQNAMPFGVISRKPRIPLRSAGDKCVYEQQAEYRNHACQPIGSLSNILQPKSLIPKANQRVPR